MASRPSASCTHELRPGTSVCLYCRHEAVLAARVRRQRFALRASIGVTALGILAFGALLVVPALRDRVAGAGGDEATDASDGTRELAAAPATPVANLDARPALPLAAEPMESAGVVPAPAPASASEAATVGGPPTPTVFAPPAPRPAEPALPRPIVAPGVTTLADGMIVERVGDTVTVSFDTPLARTRRPAKFEAIVRATLPVIYGAPADSALAAVPPGGIAAAGDLFTDLSARGLRLRAPGGATLVVTPASRPGRDGPLVVRYRTVVQR